MTKQEIIDKINTGIRGQGSMVDIGGVLADVLTELVEATPEAQRIFNFGEMEKIDTDDDNVIAQYITEFNTNNGTNFANLYEFFLFFNGRTEIFAMRPNTGLTMRLVNYTHSVGPTGTHFFTMFFGVNSDISGNGLLSVYMQTMSNAEPDSQLLQISFSEA